MRRNNLQPGQGWLSRMGEELRWGLNTIFVILRDFQSLNLMTNQVELT